MTRVALRTRAAFKAVFWVVKPVQGLAIAFVVAGQGINRDLLVLELGDAAHISRVFLE